jgi:uncharacterized lipoprotein YajG
MANGVACSLTRKDNRPSQVVILVSDGPVESRMVLIGADQELAGLLTTKLQAGFKAGNQDVTVVPASRVQRFKDQKI